MKIHTLKLTIQDMPDKNKKMFAGVFGTIFIDEGNYKKDINGKFVKDEKGRKIPLYETINFTFPLGLNKDFQSHVKRIITEALTLKDLEVEKKNGGIADYVRKVKQLPNKVKKDGGKTTRVRRAKSNG